MTRRALSPLLTLLLCLMPVVLSRAQGGTQVQISGTVAYQGCPYQNGRGRAILVSGNGSGQQAWTTGGTNPVPTPRIITALDSAGKFSMSLTSTALIDQQSAQPEWQFQLCSFNYPTTGEVCFTMTPLALTSSQDISSQIQSQSLPIPGCSSPGGGITFQHNGTVVATEPQYNMIDTGTAVWTVTDDPSHTRVNAQIAASGGGGGAPAGNLYDVQINDPLGMFGSDTGIGQIIPSLHTFYENILNANQQVDVSDATNNGLICQGHSTGSAVDAAYCTEPSATFSPTPTGGYGIFPPDNAPTAVNQALRISSVTPTNVTTKYGTIPFYPTQWAVSGNGVSLEYEFPLDFTNAPSPTQSNDLIRTLFPQQIDTAFMGPLPPTAPTSAVVNQQFCYSTVSGSPATYTCQWDSPVSPGDTVFYQVWVSCGLSCGGTAIALSDSAGNTYTGIDFDDGSANAFPLKTAYYHEILGGQPTVTATVTGSSTFLGASIVMIELRGSVVPDGHALSDAQLGIPTPQPVTTTNNTDTIIGTALTNGTGTTFTAGSGYAFLQVPANNTAAETTNVLTAGTYTPPMTYSGVVNGAFVTTAFTTYAFGTAAKPTFRLIRYQYDLTASGDFPDSTGQNGNCLAATASPGILQWLSCGSGSTPPFNNITSGTNTTATMVVGSGASLAPSSATAGVVSANQINGTSMAGLATGVLKNTTSTGVPSIAAYTDIVAMWASGSCSGYLKNDGTCSTSASSAPFNSITSGTNTTAAMVVGTGASLTPSSATAGTISANQINGTSMAGLATGLLKNTTSTGVPSIAAASDVVATFSGCSGTQYLGADGACHNAGGSGVTSVGISAPADTFAVSGSPVTTTGTLTLGKQPEAAATFMRGPQGTTTLTPFQRGIPVSCPQNSSSTFTCALNQASQAGDIIVVSAQYDASGSTHITSITDNLSQSYTLGPLRSNATTITLAWFPNTAAGVTSITVNLDTAETGIVSVTEFGNVATSPFDVQIIAGGSCSGGVVSLNALTTTNADDLLVYTYLNNLSTVFQFPLSPFLNIVSGLNGPGTHSSGMVYANFTATGTYGPTITCTTNPDTAVGVALKATSTAATSNWFWGPMFTSDLQPIGVGPLFDPTGVTQGGTVHSVRGGCTLGTSCSVTLTGSAVFSSSTSYSCFAQDTTAAAATKVAISSGSAFAITGTGTDVITYFCTGN